MPNIFLVSRLFSFPHCEVIPLNKRVINMFTNWRLFYCRLYIIFTAKYNFRLDLYNSTILSYFFDFNVF